MDPSDLKRFKLLAELDDSDRDALHELLEVQTVRKGRSIYRETGEADGVVLILSGSVVLKSRRTDENAVVGEGEVLGTASLLAMGARECTAKSQTDCQIALLSRNAYRRLVEDYPRTACRLTEAIARDLSSLLREALEPLASS